MAIVSLITEGFESGLFDFLYFTRMVLFMEIMLRTFYKIRKKGNKYISY